MKKIVVAVQTRRHHHPSCENLPKDQNFSRAPIGTAREMGPPNWHQTQSILQN
jgi:hypothetical protein